MNNQFTIVGLPLQTPDLLEAIRTNNHIAVVFASRVEKLTAESIEAIPKLMARYESAAGIMPGTGFTAATAATTAIEDIVAEFAAEIAKSEETELPAALTAARERDRILIDEAFKKWLGIVRPSHTETIVATARVQAEMRNMGILESYTTSNSAKFAASSTTSNATGSAVAQSASANVIDPSLVQHKSVDNADLKNPSQWEGLLVNGFTSEKLTRLLVHVGLVDEKADGKIIVCKESKPRAWVAIRQALADADFVSRIKSDWANWLIANYGKRVGSKRALESDYISDNTQASIFYRRASNWIKERNNYADRN